MSFLLWGACCLGRSVLMCTIVFFTFFCVCAEQGKTLTGCSALVGPTPWTKGRVYSTSALSLREDNWGVEEGDDARATLQRAFVVLYEFSPFGCLLQGSFYCVKKKTQKKRGFFFFLNSKTHSDFFWKYFFLNKNLFFHSENGRWLLSPLHNTDTFGKGFLFVFLNYNWQVFQILKHGPFFFVLVFAYFSLRVLIYTHSSPK